MNFTHNRRNFLALLAALIAFGTSAAPSLRAGEMKLEAPQKLKATVNTAALLAEHPVPGMQDLKPDQKPYWHVERARINVQRALKDAIRRITECESALGARLERGLKTGMVCSWRA